MAILPACGVPVVYVVRMLQDADGLQQDIGAVAVRPFTVKHVYSSSAQSIRDMGRVCEMKRLFVKESWQGHGVGKQLAEAVIKFAADAGYDTMVLDTLHSLQGANKLYTRLGFEPCGSYNGNQLQGVLFFRKSLNMSADTLRQASP